MKIDGKTGLLCLIGDPVEHSLSPLIHNTGLRALGLNYVYMAFKVSRDKLSQVVEAFKAIHVKGFNVTMPLKRDILHYLDEVDSKALKIGAVNTVFNESGKFVGFNTDSIGAVKALEKNGVRIDGSYIVLLGAGGTGRAIAYALMERECNIVILNRTIEKSKMLAMEVSNGSARVEWGPLTENSLKAHLLKADVIINSTSVGMKPMDNETLIPKNMLRNGLTVFDVVYDPLETRLLREAREVGAQTIDGLEMLLNQGLESFKIWFGMYPPIDPIKNVLDEVRRGYFERGQG
ncbi:MAG: shikimate dehydrogenase [Candidatus Bathyarchaeia archaeon]